MTELPDAPAPPHPRRPHPTSVRTVAYVLLSIAAGWFLLRELAPVLRPLLVAVLLAYVLLPYHTRLRARVSAPVSLVLLAGLTAGVLAILALTAYTSVLGLSEEIPGLQARAVELVHAAEAWLPAEARGPDDRRGAGERLAAAAARVAQPALAAAADSLLEALTAGLYLVFLLLEASRFPERVRRAYPPDRAEAILRVAGQVNAAIVSYLRAKVKSSLVLAVPVGAVLWVLGVKFALLWAVLTFLCNFIPYIGSVVAYSLPVGFALLQLGPDWRAAVAAALLLGCHAGSASVVEPLLLGRAVGLSPLVILGSLAFWGLLWGIPGMFLAVPLTVVAVIVMGHFRLTRPVAELVSGG
jgi:AI-2 transport protein TqsA